MHQPAFLLAARSSFQHPKSDHKAVIGRHHFNYAVCRMPMPPLVPSLRVSVRCMGALEAPWPECCRLQRIAFRLRHHVGGWPAALLRATSAPLTLSRCRYFVQVEITVPGSAELPSELRAHSQAQHCYHVAKMPLSGLLEPTLLAAIRSADVRAMSRGPRIDGENVAALLPTGELLLSLDKVGSQTAGAARLCG